MRRRLTTPGLNTVEQSTDVVFIGLLFIDPCNDIEFYDESSHLSPNYVSARFPGITTVSQNSTKSTRIKIVGCVYACLHLGQTPETNLPNPWSPSNKV